MRKTIYDAIESRLRSEVPEIEHIDLWNHQTDRLASGGIFKMPAVFVEFETIEWQQNGQRVRSGIVGIRLHLLTHSHYQRHKDEANTSFATKFLEIIDKMNYAMCNLSGDNFNSMKITSSATNHNHGEVLESIERYETLATDRSSARIRDERNMIMTPTDVTLDMGEVHDYPFEKQYC